MSKEIDERVLSMKFDNAQFEKGVKSTMGILGKLKETLKFPGARKGIEDVDKAVKKVSFSPMEAGVNAVANSFSAMSVIGITALATLTNKAVNAGLRISQALTIEPVMSGFQEYETKIGSIQTILANTEEKGENLETVNAALDNLNTYADKTIYNFTEMTRNIGTFTAAGVGLNDSVKAIKGIANLAAISGSNSQQASTAMYQLSQALAAGTVKLMDWNSVVNAGMGGETFQNALKETARAHGVAVDQIIKEQGSFRESLSKGWITSEILTETLDHLALSTNDMTAAEIEATRAKMKSNGYTDEQIDGIFKLGNTATDAATKVRTFSQLIDTSKEALQSGWTESWQLIVGDFLEATEVWTGLSDAIGTYVNASAEARNNLLKGWKDGGGRELLIKSLAEAARNLLEVMKPLGAAWYAVFPPMTSDTLISITQKFADFVKTLKPSVLVLTRIQLIAQGVFSAIKIGMTIAGGVIKVVKTLLVALSPVFDVISQIAQNLSIFVFQLSRAKDSGSAFETVLGGIKKVADFVAKSLSKVLGLFAKLTSPKTTNEVGADFKQFAENLKKTFTSMYEGIKSVVDPTVKAIKKFFSDFGGSLKEGISSLNLPKINEVLQSGLLVGIIGLIRKFKDGINFKFGLSDGPLNAITKTIDALTGHLKQMQSELKSKTLKNIAIAIGIMAVSILLLATIPADRLATSMAGLAVMLTEFGAAMKVFTKTFQTTDVVKLTAIGTAMISIAAGMTILSVAVKILSTMRWEALGKGLAGLLGALASVAAFTQVSKLRGITLRAGLALISMSVAVGAMALAISYLGKMDIKSLGKGLLGMAGALLALAVATRVINGVKVNLRTAGALISMAVAMNLIAIALKNIGGMDWESIGKGISAVAGAMTLLTASFKIMPKNIAAAGVQFTLVAAGMIVFAKAIEELSKFSWEELGKGLATIAGAITTMTLALSFNKGGIGSMMAITGGLILMVGALKILSTIPLAQLIASVVTLGAALGIVVGAVALLQPFAAGAAVLGLVAGGMVLFASGIFVMAAALKVLSTIPFGSLMKAIFGLGLAVVAIGVSALILTPVIPIFMLLSVALTAFGLGLTLTAGAVAIFATSMGIMATVGGAGAAALTSALGSVITLIPTFVKAIVEGILVAISALAEAAPQLTADLGVIISSLIMAIAESAVAFMEAATAVGMGILQAIQTLAPQVIQTVLSVLMNLLTSLTARAGDFARVAGTFIVNFLRGVSSKIGEIVQAAIKLAVDFLNGIADGIRDNMDDVIAAIGNIGKAMIDGLVNALTGGVKAITDKVWEIAESAWDSFTSFFGINSPSRLMMSGGKYIIEGLRLGLQENQSEAEDAMDNLGKGMYEKFDSWSNEYDSFNDMFDWDPTISPVLDLSNIEAGSKDIAKALEGSYGLSLNTSLTGAKSAYSPPSVLEDRPTPSENNGITYIQHNHSPKALSRTEIYRNTRNQLSQFGKVNR